MTAAEEILRFSYGGEDGILYIFINGRSVRVNKAQYGLCAPRKVVIYGPDVIHIHHSDSFYAAGHPGCKLFEICHIFRQSPKL